MASDFVFPKDNEQEFIDIALKLGYLDLYFCYDSSKKTNLSRRIRLHSAVLVNKRVKSSSLKIWKKPVDARKVIEARQADIVYDLELSQDKDFIHQRNSGLDHICARIAREKSIRIGFSFSTILNSEGAARSIILGRIRQNIRLCRKYKTKMVIASFASDPYEMRSPHDMVEFFYTLGMHKKEAKEAIDFYNL